MQCHWLEVVDYLTTRRENIMEDTPLLVSLLKRMNENQLALGGSYREAV